MGAAPVRIEVQLSCTPLEAALDEDGCLECSDAKRLLGLRPDAEVRSRTPHIVVLSVTRHLRLVPAEGVHMMRCAHDAG